MIKINDKILVLGISGFIGSNIFNYFSSKKNLSLLGISRNPKTYNSKTRFAHIKKTNYDKIYTYKNLSELIAKIKDFKPNIIINCVGLISEKKNIEKYTFSNVLYPKKIIDVSSKFGLKKFIHLSTIDTLISPLVEDKHLNYYAFTKLMGDLDIKKICNDNSVSYTLLKPSTVYGNYMNDDRLISQIFKNIKSGEKLNINYNLKKNFVNIDNICLLLSKEIKDINSKTLYLCSKKSFFIVDFLKFIEKVLNKKIDYKINNLSHKEVENIKFKSYAEKSYGTKIKIINIDNWEKISLTTSINNLYKNNKFSLYQIR